MFPLYRSKRFQAAKSFFQEAEKTTSLSLAQKIHGYIYGRWTYFYIAVGTGEHILYKIAAPLGRLLNRLSAKRKSNEEENETIRFADTYHGKVITTGSAKQLVTLNKKIDLRNLEQVIPYKRAKDIVMNNPEFIIALECPCRASRKNPCLPLDVCLIVGEPFASFVLEHHSSKAKRITAEEAEKLLEEEHKRGHVHHAFFKDVMLNRFYAICNCCSCCCGAMQVFKKGTPMLASSGYICIFDDETCKHCGLCAKKCQFEAISYDSDGLPAIDTDKCMGCGACLAACKPEALSLILDPSKPPPLEIQKLMEEAASVTSH